MPASPTPAGRAETGDSRQNALANAPPVSPSA